MNTYFVRSGKRMTVLQTKQNPDDAAEACKELRRRFRVPAGIKAWRERYRRSYREYDETYVDINGRFQFWT